MVADAIVRANIAVVGGPEALNSLRAFRTEVQGIGTTRARVQIDADTQAAKQQIAEIRNETARIRAERAGIIVTADTSGAQRSLEQIRLDTQRLNTMTARAKVEIDTTQANRALDGVLDKVSRFALYGAGYAAYGGISMLFRDAADAVIGFNSRLEQTQTAFTNALGSAGAAQQFVNQLKDFAQRTPFQFEDLTRLSQQLIGMGVASRDILPSLTAIGNAVAGVGGGTDVLNRVVLAFGQINAAGKANAQDLRQLAEAGIPIWQFLAKTLNTDVAGAMKAVSQGTVDSQTTISAFLAGSAERFGGLMDAQSKTFLGRLSNLKDAAQQEFAALGKPLADTLGHVLDEAATAIASPKFKSFATETVNDLQAVVHAGEAVATAIGKIPTPMIETAVHTAELVVAWKTLTLVWGGAANIAGGVASAVRSIAALYGTQATSAAAAAAAETANTVAMEREAAAATTATVAVERLAAAQVAQAETATAGAGANTAASAAYAGPGAGVIGALGRLPSALGRAGAIGIGMTVGFAAEQFIAEPLIQAIEREKNRIATDEATMKINMAVILDMDQAASNSPEIAQQGRAALEARKTDLENMLKGVGGDKSAADYLQAQLDQVNQKLTDTTPQAKATGANKELTDSLAGITKEFDRNRISSDQARAQAQAWASTALQDGASVAEVSDALSDFNKHVDDNVQHQKDVQYAAAQTAYALRQQADAWRAAGASEQDIRIAQQGKDLGFSPEEIAVATARLNALTERQKQAAADALQAQKDAAKAAADAQLEAAQKVETAWKQAESAVQSFAKPLTGDTAITTLLAQAQSLTAAQQALSQVGQSSASLSTLANIAQQFATIKKAEDEATASYQGYLVTLSQTDAHIQQLEGIKKGLLDAVDKAQQRVIAGTATDADLQLIAGRKDALDKLNQGLGALQTNQSSDWVKIEQSIGQTVAGIVKADQDIRSTVDALGGGRELLVTIKTNADAANQEIKDKIEKSREAQLEIKSNADAVQKQIDALARDREMNLKINTVDANGNPLQSRSVGPNGVTGNEGDSTAPPPGGGGGPLGFRPLALADYRAIVQQGAGGAQSPLDNPQVYAGVMAAAQANNVDPRALLAFMRFENGNATNISPDLLRANNYGGIKYAGQPGAARGSTSPEGDPYAIFGTPQDFFNALARNLTTGQYAPDYQAGNLTAIRQRYVTGGGPGTPAQQQNVANTVAAYNQYVAQYPGGTGAPILTGTGYGPSDVGLGSGQTPTGGQAPAAVVGGIRDQIVQKALQSVDQDKLVDECERFVEETVQAITGKRGATGKNEPTASAAYQVAKSMGLERPANQAPQAGDLVYYPDAAGGAGHVAIYMGGGKQISTWDKGQPVGENRLIHTEPVSPGARYIMVPGTESSTSRFDGGAAGTATSGAATSGAAGAQQSADFTERWHAALAAVNAEQTRLNANLAAMNPQQVTNVAGEYAKLQPLLVQVAQAKLGPDATETEKLLAAKEATAQALNVTNLWAKALMDVKENAAAIPADLAAVSAALGGGPLGAAASAQLNAQVVGQQTTDRIRTLNDAKASIQAGQQAAQEQQAAQQFATQEARRRVQVNEQAEQNRLQDRQTAEQRAFENATTAEDRRHQLATRNLDDELRAMQKLQATADSGNSATEQGLSDRMAGSSGAAKFQAGELLAIQRDFDSRNRQTLKDQIAGVEEAQIAETRRYEDAKYNITQEHTLQTRTFADEATALTRRQQREQALWAEEDAQTARQQQLQSAAAQASLASIDQQITQQQQLASDAQSAAQAAEGALQIWQSVGDAAASAGQSAASLMQQYQTQVQGLSTANGVPYSQFPAPGQFASGTDFAPGGMALVGEQGPELINLPRGSRVTPLRNRVIPNDGTAPAGVSINAPITINGVGEDDIRAAVQAFEAKLRAAVAEMKRTPAGNLGRMRGA